ncbi:MAG: hypothetical protein GXP49_11900 [Deltaproteobacteria bacterium]|nr:hypothetical protein [Deltaproteobacteria bacterium]
MKRLLQGFLACTFLPCVLGCVAGGPLEGSQKVLAGTWISPSGAKLVVRLDGTCDYLSKAEKVKDGTLIIIPEGSGGTMRCRKFLGGVSLVVDRWPVNDFRGKIARTYITLSGVEYTKRVLGKEKINQKEKKR